MTTRPDPGSGDRPPTTRLERPPGERYRAPGDRAGAGTGERTPSLARAIGLGAVVAAGGAVLLAGLGILDLGAGLIAVGLAIGWATGLAVRFAALSQDGAALGRGARSGLAGGLTVVAVGLAFLLVWVWSRTQGGTLGPLDYLGERFGLLPPLIVVLAALAAGIRAR